MVALGCLSGVIATFPPKTMSIQEVDVMTTFFCDRMEDEVSIKDNIIGLSALQTMTGFGEEEVTKICDAYEPSGTSIIVDYLMRSTWQSIHSPLDCQYIP